MTNRNKKKNKNKLQPVIPISNLSDQTKKDSQIELKPDIHQTLPNNLDNQSIHKFQQSQLSPRLNSESDGHIISQNNIIYKTGTINLVPEPLLHQLQNENNELKAKIHDMKIQENLLLNSNQELRDTIRCNEQTIDALKKENAELKLELEDLRKHVEELERKNAEQDNRITEQDKRITEQNKRIAEQNSHIKILKNDIDDLKKRDNPITARQAFLELEKYIYYEITGKQKETVDKIKDLFNDIDYKIQCDEFLKKYKITKKQILLISYLKKPGNISTHADRPKFKRSELEALIISSLDDPKNTQDIKTVKILLGILQIYIPVKEDEIWNITGPKINV